MNAWDWALAPHPLLRLVWDLGVLVTLFDWWRLKLTHEPPFFWPPKTKRR